LDQIKNLISGKNEVYKNNETFPGFGGHVYV